MKFFTKHNYLILIILLIVFISGCQDHNNTEQINNSNHKKTENKQIIQKVENYNYSRMKSQINNLKKEYNNLQVSTIGKSYQNRKLFLVKMGRGDKKIAVIGGFHGREGLTSLLTLRILEDYLKNEDINNYNITSLFNKTSLYFIPMLNPDGVNIAVNGISDLENQEFYLNANEGKKDFSRWKANARGVDLNKQFKADWNNVKSKHKPHFESYKGPSPESEPESKALADLTRKEEFDAVVCFHHSGRIIYWYYNQSGKQLKRDYNLVKALSKINQYEAVSRSDSDTTAAGYKDWVIKEFNKPGFTIEIGYKDKVEKPLSSAKLDKYFDENRCVLLELAHRLNER